MPKDRIPTPAGDLELIWHTVSPFAENAYILGDPATKACVFVDPGDEADRLAASAEGAGWTPLAILATHAHIDHVGAVAPLQDRYGVPFWIHRECLPWLEHLPDQARFFGVPGLRVPRVDHHLMEAGPGSDGRRLEVGPFSFDLLYTPGHAEGHVSLSLPGTVLSGDCLFAGSIGRTDLPGGDYRTLMESIVRELLPLDEDTRVYSGHGPRTRIGHEMKHNPFLLEWKASGNA